MNCKGADLILSEACVESLKKQEFAPGGKLIKHGELLHSSIPDTKRDDLASAKQKRKRLNHDFLF